MENKDILFGAKKILVKESALNHLELLNKEKKRLRIQVANRIKNMYQTAIFRGQVRKYLESIRVMKFYLSDFTKRVKFSILEKKVRKIQNTIKKYLWHSRLEKIKV